MECNEMANLEINNLTVTTSDNSHTLLENVSCCVKGGDILAVIGPNGAGKSSLLQSIAGDFDSFIGSINLAGKPIDPKFQAKQIAVLPQFSLLNFPYRVNEVVQLGRTPHRTGTVIDKQIIKEVLDVMDISELCSRHYTDLSGGEKQRVQIARVLAQIWRAEDSANKQRVLLLDEPTTALDLGHQFQLMKTLQQFSASNVIIIMVLHDLNLVARYTTKCLALLNSKVLSFGKTNDVLNQQTIETLFATKVCITTHPNNSTPIVLSQ